MKSKYYTPSLEEFHVGFEYEELISMRGGTAIPKEEHHETWKKIVATKSHIVAGFAQWPWITRIKYLDKADIEELGFIYYPDDSVGDGNVRWWDGFKKDEYEIKTCSAWSGYNTAIFKNNNIIFKGTILNKSELKKLLKMLRI
jgi:hypothetical protein